jgi:hypothetical protein
MAHFRSPAWRTPADPRPFVRTLLLGMTASKAAWLERLLRRHGHSVSVGEQAGETLRPAGEVTWCW